MTDPKEDLERDTGAAPEEDDDAGGDLSYDEVHVPDEEPGKPAQVEPPD
jgi:hypothetical protein